MLSENKNEYYTLNYKKMEFGISKRKIEIKDMNYFVFFSVRRYILMLAYFILKLTFLNKLVEMNKYLKSFFPFLLF